MDSQITNWQFRLIAIGMVAVALWSKFSTGGWLMLLGGFLVYPLLGIAHFLFHSRVLPKSGSVATSATPLILASHVLFIFAFLLQGDFGDSHEWLTFLALWTGNPGGHESQPPHWWPSILMNPVIFIPVFLTWARLKSLAKTNVPPCDSPKQ